MCSRQTGPCTAHRDADGQILLMFEASYHHSGWPAGGGAAHTHTRRHVWKEAESSSGRADGRRQEVQEEQQKKKSGLFSLCLASVDSVALGSLLSNNDSSRTPGVKTCFSSALLFMSGTNRADTERRKNNTGFQRTGRHFR